MPCYHSWFVVPIHAIILRHPVPKKGDLKDYCMGFNYIFVFLCDNAEKDSSYDVAFGIEFQHGKKFDVDSIDKFNMSKIWQNRNQKHNPAIVFLVGTAFTNDIFSKCSYTRRNRDV